MEEISGPRLSVVAPFRPKEVPLDSWEAETVLDYDKVYARKYSEDFRDDTATVWRSMYEKNLGRKVSRLPPWEITLSTQKESEDARNTDLRDLATIHLDRAKDIGALSEQPPFQTAESRRKERKQARGGSNTKKHKHKGRHHQHHHHSHHQ